MSRDWVKLYTCALDDADINGLSAETGWAWTRMLLVAARHEDNGRIGTARNAAYVLHTTVAVIEAAVIELDGRIIVDENGELVFRDWHDWQSQTNNERQRASRKARRAVTTANAPEPDAACHDLSRPVTGSHGLSRPVTDVTTLEETRGEERRGEERAPTGAAAEPPAPHKPRKPRTARPLGPGCALLRELTALSPPRAYQADVEAAYERYGADKLRDVAREWVGHGFNPANVAGILDVLANGWKDRRAPPRSPPADDGQHDPAFWFRSESGDWRLRPVAIALAKAGIDADPEDAGTWPAHVRELYANDPRIVAVAR